MELIVEKAVTEVIHQQHGRGLRMWVWLQDGCIAQQDIVSHTHYRHAITKRVVIIHRVGITVGHQTAVVNV